MAADDQSYYPGARMRLVLRFDEFGNPTRLAKPPTKSTKVINGVKDPRAPLVATKDTSIPGVSRFLLAPAGSTAVPPATDQGRSADGLTFDVNVIPKTTDWNQNGLRTADTLTAEFKYIDCPVDPRVIRACAVEYFLGTWSAADYGRNIAQGGRSASPGSNGDRPGIFLPDADPRTGRSFLRFTGWVDKWSVDWNDNSEPVVRIECRDNTQLFIEQEASMMHVLDMKKPLDESVAQYLSHFPQMYGITVEYRPANGVPPVLSKVLSGDAYRPNLGPHPAKGGGAGERLSVWDYLTDVCGSVGHSIRVDGTTLIIQTARSYTTSAIVRRPDDPFQGRDLAGGGRAEYRRFIYGRNVKEMRVSRAYARTVPKNIEVRSYSTEDKTLLVARFPEAADRQTYAIPGNAQPDQKWLVLRVSGIKDKKTLRIVAQAAYESVGRNELNIEVKTKNLASFGGGNADTDLLDMKTGDTIELLVERKDVGGELTKIEKALTSNAKNQAFMKVLGFSDDFAAAYAKAYVDAGFLTQFRVKAVKIAWSIDEGVEIDVQGVNYVEVRADKILPNGEEVSGAPNPSPSGNSKTLGP